MEVYEYFQPPSVIENSPVQLIGANSHVLHNNISVSDKTTYTMMVPYNYNRVEKFLTA